MKMAISKTDIKQGKALYEKIGLKIIVMSVKFEQYPIL
jgi:hypothetical protein